MAARASLNDGKNQADEVSSPRPRVVPQLRPGPKGGKRDENRRRRTKEICDAAVALFLERGIEGVTIDDIVRTAGIAKGSFYRYFKDKADLVEAIFSPYLEAMDATFARCNEVLKGARDREELFAVYRLLAESLAEMVFQNVDIFVLYLQENRAPPVGARAMVRRLAELIDTRSIELTELAQSEGLLRLVEPRITARAVVGAVEKLMFGVLHREDLGDPTEIPEVVITMMVNGLRPDPQP